MQSFDCSIEHIPGIKNPADSLSRRWTGEKEVNLVAKDEDAEVVRSIRVKKDAHDQKIQDVLNKAFGTRMRTERKK